ncbi:hypothetical protein CLOM_g6978, partial [Closterium sp. NIES-68]
FDKQPMMFWLATPFSSFMIMLKLDSGFWLEANPYMRGLSRLLPDIGSTVPFYYNWGTWDGNSAHSNLFGVRTYPHGSRPHYPSPTKNPRVSLKNFLIYRNKAGIFLFNSERLIVESGVFLDNGIGIDLSRNAGVQAKNCRFIGRSSATCPSSNQQAMAAATALDNDTTTPGLDVPTDPTSPGLGGPTDPTIPEGPTTIWEPFTLQASLGPLDPFADNSAGTSSSTSSSSSSSSGGNKAFLESGAVDPSVGVRQRAAVKWDPYNKAYRDTEGGVVNPLGLSLGNEAGSFANPIGITLSQSNPQDHLYPNAIQNTSFHRFGTCSSSSFGIALIANKAGGYWNTAMFVQGLSFSSGTNKFWATPNPSSGTPPRGGLLARFYAIRDLDGSLLGQSGYAVANYDPILPPDTVRASKCSFISAFSAYSCSSVCYRSIGLEYDEYGVRPNGMSGLPRTVLRPYSYLKITRMDDGSSFLAYGTDNDKPGSGPAGTTKKRRFLTASLLAGYTYRIEVVPAETNSNFYPSKMQLNVFDWLGCSGGVNIVIDSPNSKSKWRSDAPTVPCSSANATRVYKEYACGNGKARLQLDVGASASGKGMTDLYLETDTTTSCSSDSACSSSTSSLPPLSVSPLGGTESSFSSVDPFYDPSFYEPGTGSISASSLA